MVELSFHPAADIFPRMSDSELSVLAEDIRAHGLKVPITLADGVVLDGRNRLRACEMAGVEPRFEEFSGKDPLRHVVSLNLHRRHLNESQRAMIGAKLANMRQGARTDLEHPADLPEVSQSDAATLMNVGERTLREAKAILRHAPEKAADVEAGKKSLCQVKREIVKERVRKTAALPGKKYRVIYADPPWSYGNTQPDYHTEQRDHYPVMTLAEICALPVRDLAEENAVLFLWVTSPILEESFAVIRAWGFQYKTSFVWDKVKHNMGHYNSVRHEFLLVCVRGSCQPDVAKLFDSVQTIERTRHSEKPEAFREIIDTIYSHGRRVELFARKASKNWDRWGNES